MVSSRISRASFLPVMLCHKRQRPSVEWHPSAHVVFNPRASFKSVTWPIRDGSRHTKAELDKNAAVYGYRYVYLRNMLFRSNQLRTVLCPLIRISHKLQVGLIPLTSSSSIRCPLLFFLSTSAPNTVFRLWTCLLRQKEPALLRKQGTTLIPTLALLN